jgi:signal transduction histidine kinase
MPGMWDAFYSFINPSAASSGPERGIRPHPRRIAADRVRQQAATYSRITGRLRAVPLARRIILLTVVLLAAVYASSTLVLVHYYEALVGRERDARDAKAQLLAEHAGRAIAAIDLSLETLSEALKGQLPLEKPSIFTQLLLDKYIKNVPQVRALVVADADGREINGSHAFPPPKINLADRSFFAEQKTWRGVGLYLDRVEISRVDHKPFFAMSRPILDGDGNFRGIVAAITDPRYFANFYGPRAEELDDTILLERDDGAVLASAGATYESLAGRDRLHSQTLDRTRVSVGWVQGFPAKIVVIGTPASASPQFRTFLAMDLGLLLAMTAMASYLATAAAREAGAVGREALARRTAEARLLSAIESAPAGFALYNRDDRLVLSNDLYRSLLPPGVDLADPDPVAIGSASKADPDGGQTHQSTSAEQERIVQLRAGRWIMTRRRHTKDGDTVVFYSDITSLKEHQAQLERLNEAQRLFVDALEHIPSGLMFCDPEDRLIFCNAATRRYFPEVAELLTPGTPFEVLVRAQVATGFLPVANADPEGWIAQRMAQHRAGKTDAVRAYADGRWAQIVERRTETGYTIGIRTDITEIKQKEEALRTSEEAERAARHAAEEANHAKNAFLANMSHELRTPLNAIIGFSEMISLKLKGPLSETYREYGELVCASGRHLLSIINDILDIAKLNSGKTELHLELVDAGAVINEAVSIISKRADSAEVQVLPEFSAQCPKIEADPLRLRQVLLNLLSNAVKFTRPGGQIVVSAAIVGGELSIAVKDSGIGMAPEDIPRALEPFAQVGANTKGARDGTGLGLPISKSLIELHGGRFEIASAPELGTTVTISLPIIRTRAQTPAESLLNVAD